MNYFLCTFETAPYHREQWVTMNIHTCLAGIHVLNDSFHRELSNHIVHLIHFELIRHIVTLSGDELRIHIELLNHDF